MKTYVITVPDDWDPDDVCCAIAPGECKEEDCVKKIAATVKEAQEVSATDFSPDHQWRFKGIPGKLFVTKES